MYQSVSSNEDTIVLAHITNEGSPTLASLVSVVYVIGMIINGKT